MFRFFCSAGYDWDMAAKEMMPAEEYLRTSFDGPDREYVDGEVVERNLGNKTHSKVQRRLIVRFDALSRKHPLHVFPEMRGRVLDGRP